MTYIYHAARILLGLVFFAFGINKFYAFIPTPPIPEEAGRFFVAVLLTGYYWPLLGFVETTLGALLLSGYAVPLASGLLAPLVLNIILYLGILVHSPPSYAMAAFLTVTLSILLFAHRHDYKSLLTKPLRRVS